MADIDYVKAEGRSGRMGTQLMAVVCPRPGTSTRPRGRMGTQLMAVVCTRPGKRGKAYVSADDLSADLLPDDEAIRPRIENFCRRTGLTVPDEPIANLPADCYDNTLGITVRPYGVTTFGHLFTSRQMLCLLAFAAAVREAQQHMRDVGCDDERVKAASTYLGVLVNRQADYNSTFCSWHNTGEKIGHTFGRQALPMVWDFSELAPFGGGSGSPAGALDWIVGVAEAECAAGSPSLLTRGSATSLPYPDGR